MPYISRGRHVGYDWSGHPIVRELPDVTCADTIPDFLGLRHISYTQQGDPLFAYAWGCCDGYCTDDEIAATDCYKDATDWPLGPGPGITKRVGVFLQDLQSCLSADNRKGTLEYDSGTGNWTGSFLLRNCTLTLTFQVNPGPPGDSSKFTLSWSGSTGDSGSVSVGYGCPDPLLVNFGNISLPKCCQCPGAGSGTTDTGAEVNVWVTANCRYVKFGRHVGYEYNGSGTPVPLMAVPRNCPWDHVDPDGCTVMTCPLVASITSTSGCGCLVGDWTLDYGSGRWENITAGTCDSPATVRLSCEDAGKDSQGRSLVKLTLDVICGATNVGTANTTVLAADMENLDETFAVTMTDTGSVSCGTCTYQYNAMAMSWSQIGSACTGTCTCYDVTDPVFLAAAPASPTDGQTFDFQCNGTAAPSCCIGTISVRITRA